MNCEIKKATTVFSSATTPHLLAKANLKSTEERHSFLLSNGHVEHGTPLGITVNKNANSPALKSIMPKTAFEVLKEFKDVFIDNYTSIGSPTEGYTVSINMNNKEFEAKGRSKKDTENLVYELALRDFITSKLNDADKAQEVKDEARLHILPFALHKLFNQWEQDGYLVPITQFSTDLPVDWQTMSPVTLLTLMRKEARFVECDFSSGQGSVKPRVSIFVDNQEFTTCGRTKSIARYNAAVMACNALFQTNFNINMDVENCASCTVEPTTASPVVKTTLRTDLPIDWHTKCPYILLHIMRPAAGFQHWQSQNAAGRDVYHAGVTVDKQNFTACAFYRRLAIENVSAIACNTLFHTNFTFSTECKFIAGSSFIAY